MGGPVGRTKDVGWQIGVSRTLPHPVEEVWALVTGPAGLAVWLGAGVPEVPPKGGTYRTTDGTTGEVRGLRGLDRVRLTHRLAGSATATTVQVTVSAAPGGTTLRFHQEHLAGPDERERQRTHWQGVVGRLAAVLDGG